jgi:signal transduction histidine kinase
MCQALVELVSARARRQFVNISLDAPEQAAEVVGFPDRVHVALLNLIINALDAMPDGGSLRITVARTTMVRVMVCDTGDGVDPASANDIWRLHYTTKPGGTGIGLHVTREVVEAHGGVVSQHANPGGGACFVIELPSAS